MNDLVGLDWSSSSNANNAPKPPPSNTLSYASLRPTPPPISGRSTPLLTTTPQSRPSLRPVKSSVSSSSTATDNFSSLVSFGGNSANKGLTLQQQQRRLQEQRVKDAERFASSAAYTPSDARFWDSLATKGANNAINPDTAAAAAAADEDDLLAAFNSNVVVDASTNFPPPGDSPALQHADEAGQSAGTSKLQGSRNFKAVNGDLLGDDDDPFGLHALATASKHHGNSNDNSNLNTHSAPVRAEDGDDDVLGPLGKPVSEIAMRKSPEPKEDEPCAAEIGPKDRALAELVDMGFPVEKSLAALQTTESGLDVQAAVGWLLNQAHEESRQKANASRTRRPPSTDRRARGDAAASSSNDDSTTPAWMRQGRRSDSTRRHNSNGNARPDTPEKDAAQIAAEIGQNLFKTANSLWKTGTKKVQQAVSDFQHPEKDASQPRWMRDARTPSNEHIPTTSRLPSERTDAAPWPKRAQAPLKNDQMTEEAMMLEGSHSHPVRTSQHELRSRTGATTADNGNRTRPQGSSASAAFGSLPLRPATSPPVPRSKLNRALVEEQSAQAYISPARRRKQHAAQSRSVPATSPEPELSNSALSSKQVLPQRSNPAIPAKPSSLQFKATPRPPHRIIPSLDPASLAASTACRKQGTESFKRGDYPAAHTFYTNAMKSLPQSHPITIVLLCNRSLTSLKVGEPKSAIFDADSVLSIIGPSRGQGEKIFLGPDEPEKDMRDFYGKALMRKAEALEQMEKWADAAKIWRDAVEAGHGGSASIQGRNRCEKAAGVSSDRPSQPTFAQKPVAKKTPPPAAKQKSSALADLAGHQPAAMSSAPAVNRLRAANEAAAQAEEERFALTDTVDAKLAAWKNGKQDNLRALLGSLDSILWPEAGWKKVGMSELIVPTRVKIVYMKGIAKVHPDKIPTNATTEQRMISAAVFSLLNDAWDKFKKDNNL